MHVIRIDLAYDGTGFSGFARQEGVRTVQGDLEAALERVLGRDVATTCAGRTDRGVHARHQVVTFEIGRLADLARLWRSLDGILGPEVSVVEVTEAAAGFNARFSPAWRRYRYFVDPRPSADPLLRSWVWHLGSHLDLDAMNRAAAELVGLHDFASFCRRREGTTTVREVFDAGWWPEDGRAVFEVRAKAFCHQMVRSMVGLCIDVGVGRVDPDAVVGVIAAADRNAVGTVAPPHGLVLWEVGFD